MARLASRKSESAKKRSTTTSRKKPAPKASTKTVNKRRTVKKTALRATSQTGDDEDEIDIIRQRLMSLETEGIHEEEDDDVENEEDDDGREIFHPKPKGKRPVRQIKEEKEPAQIPRVHLWNSEGVNRPSVVDIHLGGHVEDGSEINENGAIVPISDRDEKPASGTKNEDRNFNEEEDENELPYDPSEVVEGRLAFLKYSLNNDSIHENQIDNVQAVINAYETIGSFLEPMITSDEGKNEDELEWESKNANWITECTHWYKGRQITAFQAMTMRTDNEVWSEFVDPSPRRSLSSQAGGGNQGGEYHGYMVRSPSRSPARMTRGPARGKPRGWQPKIGIDFGGSGGCSKTNNPTSASTNPPMPQPNQPASQQGAYQDRLGRIINPAGIISNPAGLNGEALRLPPDFPGPYNPSGPPQDINHTVFQHTAHPGASPSIFWISLEMRFPPGSCIPNPTAQYVPHKAVVAKLLFDTGSAHTGISQSYIHLLNERQGWYSGPRSTIQIKVAGDVLVPRSMIIMQFRVLFEGNPITSWLQDWIMTPQTDSNGLVRASQWDYSGVAGGPALMQSLYWMLPKGKSELAAFDNMVAADGMFEPPLRYGLAHYYANLNA